MHILFKVILSYLLFTTWVASAKIPEYNPADTLFVWADAGTAIRKSPDFSAEIIGELGYGESIVVREIVDRKFDYEMVKMVLHQKDTFPRFLITGNFIKINHAGSTGYVFDGVLSKLIPANPGESCNQYFTRTAGVLKTIENLRPDNAEYKFQRVIYNNGAIVQQENGVENSWNYLYLIPDITLTEAYLLFNKLTDFEKRYHDCLNGTSDWIETYPTRFQQNEIILQSGSFEETTIRIANRYIEIIGEGGN